MHPIFVPLIQFQIISVSAFTAHAQATPINSTLNCIKLNPRPNISTPQSTNHRLQFATRPKPILINPASQPLRQKKKATRIHTYTQTRRASSHLPGLHNGVYQWATGAPGFAVSVMQLSRVKRTHDTHCINWQHESASLGPAPHPANTYTQRCIHVSSGAKLHVPDMRLLSKYSPYIEFAHFYSCAVWVGVCVWCDAVGDCGRRLTKEALLR